MQKKQPPKLFLLIFILIGLYFFLVGFFPVKVEINPTSVGTQAQIHRKSMIPPFKTIDIFIPNVKQAVITTSRTSKGGTTYRVELEDFKGYRFPITTYFSSGYNSKANLQDRINVSITNRTDFRHTFPQPFFTLFGSIFIIIPLIMLIAVKKTQNNTYQQSRPRQYQDPKETPEEFKRPQGFPISQQTQHAESEEEKYKNINDSIIK